MRCRLLDAEVDIYLLSCFLPSKSGFGHEDPAGWIAFVADKLLLHGIVDDVDHRSKGIISGVNVLSVAKDTGQGFLVDSKPKSKVRKGKRDVVIEAEDKVFGADLTESFLIRIEGF